MRGRAAAPVFVALWLLARPVLAGQATPAPVAPPPATPAPQADPPARAASLRRWFDLQTATLSVRYREVETSEGEISNNQIQHQESFRFRFIADRRDRYSLHAGIFSGVGFGGGWNNTGIGTGEFTKPIHVKQLFLSAEPVSGFELQVGSFPFWRGESTEITTYDNDGFLTGARLSVQRPDELFLDEVTYVQARLDPGAPMSVFDRLEWIGDVNYRLVGLVKQLATRASLSADYTSDRDVDTVRGAVRVEAPELRAVDRLRLELYRRLDDEEGGGFAVAGEKQLKRWLTVVGGFSSIDEHYTLNGDRYGRGRHIFALGNVILSPEFSMQGFVTRAVWNDFSIPNGTRVDVVLIYNLRATLQKRRILP